MAGHIKSGLIAAFCCVLVGCGGSTPEPPVVVPDPVAPVKALPGDAQSASVEVNQGSFQIYYAQSKKDLEDPTKEVEVTFGQADFYSVKEGEIRVRAGSENYLFFQDNVTPKPGGNSTEYEYFEEDGELRMVVNRWSDGTRDGYIIVGSLDQPSDLRASFYYGWSTDPTRIPATGVATYSNDGGGQIFLSDGKRLFNGKTSLNVDFAAKTVDGVLVDTIGREQNNLAAKLTLTGGKFNTAGEISANGGLLLELINDQSPFTSVDVTKGSLSGRFLGVNAEALAGYFEGTADVAQTGFSASTVTFSGIFGGAKIPTIVVVPPVPPVTIPTPPLVLPGTFVASAEDATQEVGLGSFDVFFAQSNRDPAAVRNLSRATISTGRVKMFSPSAGNVIVELASGVRYEFVESFVNRRSGDTIEYSYAEKNGGPETLFITRDRQGNQRGYFSLGPTGGVANLRSWVHYGYPTDPALLTTGVATYSDPGEGRLFLSDGWRLFNGSTDLTADFGAGLVNGTLFDNTSQVTQPLKAKVTLTNGQINGGRILGNDVIGITLSDTNDPYTSVSAVTGGSIDGQFVGNAGENLIGTYQGTVDVDQTNVGTGPLSFGGSFSATKQ